MDVIIPVRPGPNPELRYALRSLANFPHGDVIIVGDPPDWVTNVTIVPGNFAGTPQRNGLDNLIRGFAVATTDQVLITNDDIYITEPVDEIPSLYRSTLAEHISSLAHRKDWWTLSLRHTAVFLAGAGIAEPLSYELHIPLVADRVNLATACKLAFAADETPPQWRSVYGNLFHVPATRAESDVKLYNAAVPLPRPFASTHDAMFPPYEAQLATLFPNPSPYEKPQA